MADLVPHGDRIDRAALERIVQRAAELQLAAGDREIGEELTEAEVLQLGTDVGIPARYLQQALVEERSRALTGPERGLAVWLAGPRVVAAQRVIAGRERDIEEALRHWMEEGELLAVKRRLPGRTTWEARRGTVAALKRSLGAGGRKYLLARAHEIGMQVAAVDAGRCHVRLDADLSNTRREHLGGAAGMAVTGLGLTAVGVTLGVAAPVAGLAGALGLALGFGIARHRRTDLERMHTALEQILDRLEHGEIRAPAAAGPQPGPLERLAEEVRRAIGTYRVDE